MAQWQEKRKCRTQFAGLTPCPDMVAEVTPEATTATGEKAETAD